MTEKLRQLPLEERIKVVEDLWDSIAAEQNAVRLTAEQAAELDLRLDAYELDRKSGRPIHDAIEDVRNKL